MKSLKDFEVDINKCSKCGLCQAVCPVFQATGNECAVSKGKFVMLQGVLRGDLKLGKTINKYLDMCLKCGKCKDFCPSNIDVCKIFESAKYECVKDTFGGRLIFFLQSELVFGNLMKLISRKYDGLKSNSKLSNSKTSKLLYFRGCAGKIFRHTDKILEKLEGIEIIEQEFDCCGIPFLSGGNLERYERARKHNMELIENSDYDYILTDCASCESSLRDYSDKYNIISLGELLVKQKAEYHSNRHLKVTFHKPCHLKNADFVKPLFENIENIEYTECGGYDDCCGFAGEFWLKNRKLSKIISQKKAENIMKTNADIVITTCPACILGLKQGLKSFKNPPKVLSLSEFISNLL